MKVTHMFVEVSVWLGMYPKTWTSGVKPDESEPQTWPLAWNNKPNQTQTQAANPQVPESPSNSEFSKVFNLELEPEYYPISNPNPINPRTLSSETKSNKPEAKLCKPDQT